MQRQGALFFIAYFDHKIHALFSIVQQNANRRSKIAGLFNLIQGHALRGMDNFELIDVLLQQLFFLCIRQPGAEQIIIRVHEFMPIHIVIKSFASGIEIKGFRKAIVESSGVKVLIAPYISTTSSE